MFEKIREDGSSLPCFNQLLKKTAQNIEKKSPRNWGQNQGI